MLYIFISLSIVFFIFSFALVYLFRKLRKDYQELQEKYQESEKEYRRSVEQFLKEAQDYKSSVEQFYVSTIEDFEEIVVAINTILEKSPLLVDDPRCRQNNKRS
jgi:hypothetical protein